MRSPDDCTLSIPPELLSRVFQLAQHVPLGSDWGDRKRPLEMVVSHVSGFWRDVALGTGLLWQQIRVEPECSMDRLRLYLSRSGPQTPLHLHLNLTPRAPHGPEALAEKLDLVFQHLHRWQRVTVHAQIECAEAPFIGRLYDQAAPMLEWLGLCVHDVDAPTLRTLRRSDLEQILTRGCPRLSVVRLRGLSMHFFRPPLSTITTLHLEQTRDIVLGFEGFKNLVSAAPMLTHLSIHDNIVNDLYEERWPFHRVSSVIAHSLISLRLSIPATLQGVFSGVLITLDAPNLATLILKEPTHGDLDDFISMPGASTKFPALRSLTFHDFDCNSVDDLCQLCTVFPLVEEFTLIHNTVEVPSVLLMLAEEGGRQPDPWPALNALHTTLDANDLSLVRDAVDRRRKVGRPLEVLRLSPSIFEDAEDGDLDAQEVLDWLCANVRVVEPLIAIERWPPGSNEDDPDDTLFS